MFYDYAEVPADILAAFVTRRAFIYALEVVVQIIALASFGRRMPETWIAFIDSVAGQCALTKDYSKDPAVNGILTAFWSLAARRNWQPFFELVTSAANTSDAVSRADTTRARREGWCRVRTPHSEVLEILAHGAGDLEHASERAAVDLESISISDGWLQM